jgi:hypothetical protein
MQSSSFSIQTMREAPAPQQFAQLLRELITQHGVLEQSNTAPLLNIPKLLSQLAQIVNPSVQVPQDSTLSRAPPPYLPLALVNKPNLTTAELAYYLNRRPQTLRGWACNEDGPIRPKRIGGLLAWNTAEVKTLTGVTTA